MKMLINLEYFLIVITVFSCFHGALSVKKGYYTIVSPGEVRPGSLFHVSLTLNDFHKSCWFNLSLTTFVREDKFHDFGSIEVEPETTKLVALRAPDVDYSVANLEVIGYRGIISKDSASIYFRFDKIWAFIQTDKAKYRPGDLVQIRVICIDQLTRPAELDENVTVKIYDDQHNLVKEISNAKFIQSVLKTELQLSNNPVLGVWSIRVDGGGIFTNKHFEVDRYVLPNFNLEINAQTVTRNNKLQILLEITASYFFGEPVKGNLTISIANTQDPFNEYVQNLEAVKQKYRIDGNITILLDLEDYIQIEDNNEDKKSLNAYSMSTSYHITKIEANVIDDISEEQVWTQTDSYVYNRPYRIELEVPENFYSRDILEFKIKVSVRDRTYTLIEDTKIPIEIVVGCDLVIGYNRNLIKFDTFRFDYKNEIGKDYAIVNVTNKNYNECFAYAEYEGCKSGTERMYKKEELFEINILTENPQEGKELEIEITNPDPFEEFSYEIVSRGDIILSDRVYVPGNQKTYILRLNVTYLMVPKITIYAHHIRNMSFGGQLKDVIIKRARQNSIEIEMEKETKPGTPVHINVITDEGSYVGLMGIDKRALQSINEEDIFDEDSVAKELKRLNSEINYPVPFYGVTANIITFSNVFPPGRENGPTGGEDAGGGGVERIRNLFPESWLFKDFERTPKGGFNFMETSPDTITSWAITGFSLNPETGLTFTKNTTSLKVFQEFFVSMDLPSLVKEGEIIEVPVYISNYMNHDALTDVTIVGENFDVLENPETSKSMKSISKLVAKKKREKIIFFFKPLKPGKHNVIVKAISSEASDAIQKVLNVETHGISYSMTKTCLVNLPEESIQENEITIDIPEDALPESQRAEVSIVGDIFQPLIISLQKLARVPYGSSEDNIKLVVSNSIVLKYLTVLNYSDPSLENKMKLNLELGYQNQLSFKYLDGSFGLFERKSERTGDIWQTIFALWGLRQADDFIVVDSKIIDRGLKYLKSKQQENGCYKSASGIEEDVKFTAFGLMVFLMDEESKNEYNEVITKGLGYLYEVSGVLEYSPFSVLSAYVLHLGKHEKAGDYLRKLISNTSLTSNEMIWTKKSETLQSDLEITANSLINLFDPQEQPEQNLLHIAKGLIVKNKEETAITHMVALDAIISFAEKLFLSKTNLHISFKDDQNTSGDVHLNDENSQVLQTFGISQNSQKLQIQSKGRGFAIVNVKYNYNLLPKNQSSSFYATNISVEIYSKFLIYLPICLKDLRNNTQNKFIILEVNLQSGYKFTDGNYNDIDNESEDIKSVQFNDGRDKALVYFENNPSNDSCIELEARKIYKVFNSKPGWVFVYGEHDKDQKSSSSFMIDDS